MIDDLKHLEGIVVAAAREELLPHFARIERRRKADGSVVTAADYAAQARIARELQRRWPQVAFLGEEMARQVQSRCLAESDVVWCVDPIDGTRNFAAGIPYFSISLALVQGGRVALAVVYDPMRDECFSASEGRGATLNGQPLVLRETALSLRESIGLVDFKRLPAVLAGRLATDPPYASQRSFGSIALDWCWMAAGRCHLYLHGKQNLWDYAAGHLIFQEAGGYSATLSGEPVFLPDLQPRSAAAAVDGALFEQWMAWLVQ